MHPDGMHMLNGNGIFYRAMHPDGMRNTPKRTAARKSSFAGGGGVEVFSRIVLKIKILFFLIFH
jgi:hypothetical protein